LLLEDTEAEVDAVDDDNPLFENIDDCPVLIVEGRRLDTDEAFEGNR
jgi:hypothetical protein